MLQISLCGRVHKKKTPAGIFFCLRIGAVTQITDFGCTLTTQPELHAPNDVIYTV